MTCLSELDLVPDLALLRGQMPAVVLTAVMLASETEMGAGPDGQ